MDTVFAFFEKPFFRRTIILLVIGGIIYLLRGMINLMLLAFIVTFMMASLQDFLSRHVGRFIKIPDKVWTIVLYVGILGLLGLGVSTLIPMLIAQGGELVEQVKVFLATPQQDPVIKYFVDLINGLQFKSLFESSFKTLTSTATSVGEWGINIGMTIILSLFFLLERKEILNFTRRFRDSKMGPFYEEIHYFAERFSLSFGKVIETQFLIALINGILSSIMLLILQFPSVAGLGLMIFLLGLIPVAGTIISLVPLSIIAYSVGGPITVLYVLIMIAVLHALEAYVLNPKLMSAKVHLPVFYTFVVLIASEKLMGVWGLIIGLPLFIFVLDIMGVKTTEIKLPKLLDKANPDKKMS